MDERLLTGPDISRPPSFERRRPEEDIRQRPSEAERGPTGYQSPTGSDFDRRPHSVRRATGPPSPYESDFERRPPPERRATGPQSPQVPDFERRPQAARRPTNPQSPIGSDYGRRLQPERRATGPRPPTAPDFNSRPEPHRRTTAPRNPMEYDEYDDGPPSPRDCFRRQYGPYRGHYPEEEYVRNRPHHPEEDYARRDFRQPPFAPEPPGSPTTSSNTQSSQASIARSLSDHWLPIVYEQSQPTTPLTSGGSRSTAPSLMPTTLRLTKI